MQYKSVAFSDELKAKAKEAAGVYDGRDLVQELGFTVDDVCRWGEEGTLFEHGIGIGDYFMLGIPNPSNVYRYYKMQIAGIDTYAGTMYGEVPSHHIDWISKELTDETRRWNQTGFNNGCYRENEDEGEIEDATCPWFFSDIKMYLNAESGTTADNKTVNYTTMGLLARLNASTDPNAIAFRGHLKEKYMYLEARQEDGETLTEDDDWIACHMGKLWLPTEVEVWGRVVWGDKTYGGIMGTQYPIFRNNANIPKKRIDTGSFSRWWLASVRSGSSDDVCYVDYYGFAYYNLAGSICAFPVCART